MLRVGIDDRPKGIRLVLYSLQQGLLSFAGSLSVCLLFANGLSDVITLQDNVLIVQCGLLTCCISTLINCIGIQRLGIGPRLPIISTCSYTFVLPMTVLAHDPNIGLSGAFGAAIISSLILLLVGPFLITRLKKYLTPVVSGSVILAVGLCLMESGFGNLVNFDPESPDVLLFFTLGIGTFILAIVLSSCCKGFIQSIAVLIAIIVGYIAAIILGLVDFTAFSETPFVSYPKPFAFGISFPLAPIVTLTIVHIATFTENVGDCTNISYIVRDRAPTEDELKRCLRGTATGSVVSAIFNGVPVISGSDNAGLMRISGVGSRLVFICAGAMLGVLSFFPKVSLIFSLIPAPVLGGITLLILGTIAGSGISIISQEPIDDRNLIILGVSLAVGIGGGYAIGYLSFLPSTTSMLITGIPGTAVTALLLNIILPHKVSESTEEKL